MRLQIKKSFLNSCSHITFLWIVLVRIFIITLWQKDLLTLSCLSISTHRNQANNPPQQNAPKTPKKDSHAQLSYRSTAWKFNKNFTLPRVLTRQTTKVKHSSSPHRNQPSDRKRVIILHTESFRWTGSNIPKQEINVFKLNAFLIRFLPYLYTARIW